MKRGLFSDKERTLIRKVEQEHELFRYKMLASSSEDIYNRCNEIRFYECVFEYFQYCENIQEEHLDICLKETDVLAALWEIYIKNEYLRADTWKDIEQILQVLMQRQKESPVMETDYQGT